MEAMELLIVGLLAVIIGLLIFMLIGVIIMKILFIWPNYDCPIGLSIGVSYLSAILKEHGYHKVSLSVWKANYAVKMYREAGFEIVGENEKEYIMLCSL